MKAVLFSAVLLLAACAAGPIPPEWQSQSHAAMERFRQQYLDGSSKLAERSFAEAKAAVASTGRPALLARVQLVRCALATAALDFDTCADFDTLRDDATEDDRVFRSFLNGQWQSRDLNRLPTQYRNVVSARDEAARNKSMQQIEDPVSRLVAAGVLFRLAQLSPDGLAAAIESASAQGYRRPLLAYLNVQATRAEAAGDTEALKSIQKRINLVYQSLPKTN